MIYQISQYATRTQVRFLFKITIRLNSNFSIYGMPDESCRCCGGSLTDRKVCKKCLQSTSETCTECGNHTLEKFHVMCNISDNNSEICQTQISVV